MFLKIQSNYIIVVLSVRNETKEENYFFSGSGAVKSGLQLPFKWQNPGYPYHSDGRDSGLVQGFMIVQN